MQLDGKVILVTGANRGIGFVAARELARMGATVLASGRRGADLDAATAKIREETGNGRVEGVVADLSSMAEVRRLAAEVLDRHDRLDVLLNNAGLILNKRRVTVDGLEYVFAVNHLAPFLLTKLLRDRLLESAPARVVTVSSCAHERVDGLRFDDLQSERHYSAWQVYGESKLANILFTRALARRLDGSGVTANCLHPGVIRTGFGRDGDLGTLVGFLVRLAGPFLTGPEKGARTSIYLCSSPEVAEVTGEYFVRCRPARTTAAARDEEAAERLWHESERLVAG